MVRCNAGSNVNIFHVDKICVFLLRVFTWGVHDGAAMREGNIAVRALQQRSWYQQYIARSTVDSDGYLMDSHLLTPCVICKCEAIYKLGYTDAQRADDVETLVLEVWHIWGSFCTEWSCHMALFFFERKKAGQCSRHPKLWGKIRRSTYSFPIAWCERLLDRLLLIRKLILYHVAQAIEQRHRGFSSQCFRGTHRS